MKAESYNQRQIGRGALTSFDLLYLWNRFPELPMVGAVRAFQEIRGLAIDGMIGPRTIAALPTRTLRADDRESIVAAALLCTLPAQPYRWGKEVQVRECRLHTIEELREHALGDWPAQPPTVDALDCSELVELVAWSCGVHVGGKPLRDGSWRQYAQLAELGHVNKSPRPGDLFFMFRDERGQAVDPGDQRPHIAHVAIVLSGNLHTVEAAPEGCGIYRPRHDRDETFWTHSGRLIP